MKDLKYLYFDLLEYLSDYGIGTDINIKPFLSRYEFKFERDEESEINNLSKLLAAKYNALESIKNIGHITLPTEPNDVIQLQAEDGIFLVSITKEGLDYYFTHLLRKATLRSFKNQKWINGVTWFISCVSIGIAAYFGLKSNSLEARVTELQKRVDTIQKRNNMKPYRIPTVPDTVKKKG